MLMRNLGVDRRRKGKLWFYCRLIGYYFYALSYGVESSLPSLFATASSSSLFICLQLHQKRNASHASSVTSIINPLIAKSLRPSFVCVVRRTVWPFFPSFSHSPTTGRHITLALVLKSGAAPHWSTKWHLRRLLWSNGLYIRDVDPTIKRSVCTSTVADWFIRFCLICHQTHHNIT